MQTQIDKEYTLANLLTPPPPHKYITVRLHCVLHRNPLRTGWRRCAFRRELFLFCFFFCFFSQMLPVRAASVSAPGSHRTPPVSTSIWCPHIELCGLSVRACGCWFCVFFWQTCWCNWHDAIIQQAWTVSEVVMVFCFFSFLLFFLFFFLPKQTCCNYQLHLYW